MLVRKSLKLVTDGGRRPKMVTRNSTEMVAANNNDQRWYGLATRYGPLTTIGRK